MLSTLAEIDAIDKECIVTHALFECHMGAIINKALLQRHAPFSFQ